MERTKLWSGLLGALLASQMAFTGSVAGAPIPAATVQEPPVPASASDNSVNWAGYVATGGSYSSVAGTWTVPNAQNPTGNGADTTWVGVGGSITNDLIQAGTEQIPDFNGAASYSAWYETLPGDSVTVPLDVSPGDSVSVMITKEPSSANDQWLISFRNNTTGKSYATRVRYDSSLSSAEWIEEVPIVVGQPTVLDQFGTVPFTGGFAIKDGKAVTIAQSGAKPLTMNNAEHESLAVPSQLAPDGMSFSVTRTDASPNAIAMTPYGIASISDTPDTNTQYGSSGDFAFTIPLPTAPIISIRHSHGESPWRVVVFQW